jgi:carbon storage regulator
VDVRHFLPVGMQYADSKDVWKRMEFARTLIRIISPDGPPAFFTADQRIAQFHVHREVVEMLVLTRKLGEAIFIGDGICLEVLNMKGGRVALGITAPRDVSVLRREVVLSASEAKPLGESERTVNVA